MKKKEIFLVLGVLIVLTVIGIIFSNRKISKSSPNGISINKDKFPITGIDISAHTGEIDFDKILTKQIDFVYLKATEGQNFIDPKFNKNYSNASKRKITVGFYHFFRFNKGGEIQANHFLKHTINKKTNLPLVIDVEEWGNVLSKSKEDVVLEISKFIKTAESKTKRKLMIYTNESGYKTYIKGNFDNNDIWICSFNPKPNIKKKWTLWQHSHKGKIDGAEGWVDINTFNGTKVQWEKYLKKLKI